MTWTSPVALILPPDQIYTEGGLQTTVSLSATNTRQAFLFRARSDASVQSVFFRTGTVTTSQSLTLSVQSVDATSQPSRASGTILGATSNGSGTVASPAASTLYEVTLGETVALTAGTQYAVVVEWTSTTGTAQIVVHVNTGFMPLGRSSVFVHRQTYISGAWGTPVWQTLGVGFAIGVRTDAANWWMPEFAMPGSSVVVNTTYGSTSSPDEYGNKLYLPAGDVTGLWVASDQDGGGTVVLYDNSDNVVVSATIVPNERGNSGYGCCLYPVAPTAITEGWYRVTQKPDTTTTVSRFICTYTSNQQDGRAMGSNCCLTQRTDNGAWTDTATGQMMIGVEMDPTFGAGSGGGIQIARGMHGGMR